MARVHWKSRAGFVLAAAGSAVGLGNIWKFPYIAGVHGGGAFVLIYLLCIVLVGLPVMVGEVLLGRMTQKSPVGAYGSVAGKRSPWVGFGILGVVAAFILLSFYSVVAGWAMHYAWLAASGGLAGRDPVEVERVFASVSGSSALSLGWHAAFMLLTIFVVRAGVQSGIERGARILMPALVIMLLALLVKAAGTPGFARALDFTFGTHTDQLTAEGVLEALGHAFFTLSLGMGGMITYGSYLDRDASIVANSCAITALDTAIALLACLVLYPITFSYGLEPTAGPGLVFQSIPMAMAQMPGGGILSVTFFLLLVFAALTSSIALLEVAASYFIDQRGWSRSRAVVSCGAVILLLGIPSALSRTTDLFGADFAALTGRNWFDFLDYLVSNWGLPIGGLGTALFCAWRLEELTRREEYVRNSTLGRTYGAWLLLMRWVVPLMILLVIAHKLGLIGES